MPNRFPARDRKSTTSLAVYLRLEITWGEYDTRDQSLITLLLPGGLSLPVPEDNGEGEEWEDIGEEGDKAVDHVLGSTRKRL